MIATPKLAGARLERLRQMMEDEPLIREKFEKCYIMRNVERIEQMEHRLDKVMAVVQNTDVTLEQYETVREDIRLLNSYLGSDDWKEDLAADEAGLLPADLKRGVLSQDGIYNLLERWEETLK